MKNLHLINDSLAGIPKDVYLVAQNYSAMVINNELKFRFSPSTDTLWYWLDRNNGWTIFPKEHYKYWRENRSLKNKPQIEIV